MAVTSRLTPRGAQATTSGSKTVTGTGTAWTSAMVGMQFTELCPWQSGGAPTSCVISDVASVQSSIGLTLTENAQASNSASMSYQLKMPVLSLASTPSVFAARTEHVAVDCALTAGLGAENLGSQEFGGFSFLNVSNCTDTGIFIGNNQAQNGDYDHLSWGGTTTESMSTIGMRIYGLSMSRPIYSVTITGKSGNAAIGSAIEVNADDVMIIGFHCENSLACIETGNYKSARNLTVVNMSANSTTTDAIDISAVGSNVSGDTFIGIDSGGATNTIKDERSGRTITDQYLSFYTTASQASGQTGWGPTTNCTNTSSPAQCGSASSGIVATPTATASIVIDTTAVTANSDIVLTEGNYAGTRLGITCDTATLGRVWQVTALTAGTSFTATANPAPAAGTRACVTFSLIN